MRRHLRAHVRHCGRFHVAPQRFAERRRLVEPAPRQQQDEFFTAEARDEIVGPAGEAGADAREFAQALVAVQVAVRIVERLEGIRIHEQQPQATGNDLKATVLDVSFSGVATQYLVTTESGATWSVYEQNLDVQPHTTRPGDIVWLGWDPAHAFAVDPDEEAAREAAEAVA